MDTPTATGRMVDIAFPVSGSALPRDHRRALAAAVEGSLPWLADEPDAGLHRLNVSAGGGAQALLSGRTRLTLRLPRERAQAALALEGAQLDMAGQTLHVGAGQLRDLHPWGTLYAHLVTADDDDEAAFLRTVENQLAALGVASRAICGRHQALAGDRLQGFSLMLDSLSARDALRLMEAGLGLHRLLGCGVFIPHKSAAAVGAPP